MTDSDLLAIELDQFLVLQGQLEHAGFSIESTAENAIVVSMANRSPANKLSLKDIDLCFVGLTHGDEVAGLVIINELMRKLATKELRTDAKLAFVLGNVPAALAKRRFLEKDLNRAFCVPTPTHKEELRARELEFIFSRCDFIFDMHQTIQPSASAFFLFEYKSQTQLDLVRRIDARLPAVISLETFSNDGLGIEEFACPLGATTITVELGQMGFHNPQKENGLRLCLQFLRAVDDHLLAQNRPLPNESNPLFTWGYIGRFLDSEARLDPGWMNFSPVEAGQRLGVNGKNVLRAPCPGKMLFPKYNPPQNREVELFRILKSLHQGDLPPIGKSSQVK